MANIWMINRVVLIRWVIVIVAMVVIAPRAEATIITPVAQERYVKADAVAGDPDIQSREDHASDFASGFDPFDSTVSASVYEGWLWASASQSSIIWAKGIIASGSAESNARGEVWTAAKGVSSFSLTFELAAPQQFTIAGLLSADSRSSSAHILFTGPLGTILDKSAQLGFGDPPMRVDFGISGILDPGQYTLAASSKSGSGSAAFDFVCEIPEPGTLVLFGLGIGYFVTKRQREKIKQVNTKMKEKGVD